MKRKKLTPFKTIYNRLYRLASEACRKRAGFKCEVCGVENGTIVGGKPVRLEGHHLIPRDASQSLKFEHKNLISLCTSHHKFSREISAHKNPLVFFQWYQQKYKENLEWLLANKDNPVNLKDREYLQKIEDGLKEIINN